MADQSVQINNTNAALPANNTTNTVPLSNNNHVHLPSINNKKRQHSFKAFKYNRFRNHYDKLDKYNNNRDVNDRFNPNDEGRMNYHRYEQDLYWRNLAQPMVHGPPSLPPPICRQPVLGHCCICAAYASHSCAGKM